MIVVDSPAAADANAAWLQAELDAGRSVALPEGVIYLGRTSDRWASVRIRTSGTSLSGRGRDRTRLVQVGDARGAQWDAIVIDGAAHTVIRDLRLEQGQIDAPKPTDHHALLGVYALAGDTTDTTVRNCVLGPAIGDGIRVLGDVYEVRDLTVLGCAIDLRGHPHGARGLGLGGRAGIAIQRGFCRVLVARSVITGSKNPPILVEASGHGRMERLDVEDVDVVNTGTTDVAIALYGLPDHRLSARLDDVRVRGGRVAIGDAHGVTIGGLTVDDGWIEIAQGCERVLVHDVTARRCTPGPALTIRRGARATLDVEIRRAHLTPELTTGDGALLVDGAGDVRISDVTIGGAAAELGVKLRSAAGDVRRVRLRDLDCRIMIAATNGHAVDDVSIDDSTSEVVTAEIGGTLGTIRTREVP